MQGKSMIGSKVAGIIGRIQQVRKQFNIKHYVRLVAVSKTKPVDDILNVYEQGIRHFGQNYVDEIEQKHDKLPADIKWHFIGHLQSNKIKKILVPNLEYIESVDRQSLAQKLQKELVKQNRLLKILIQVKTSQEQSKSGAGIEQLDQIYSYISNKCPHLIFKGLMTIGKQGDLAAFGIMQKLKQQLCQKHELKGDEFQLSMGMSGDFEQAIEHGSTSVRVGSSIFGQRNYPKK